MSDLTLKLSDDRRELTPGERIAGSISWRLDRSAKAIEVRLFWYTVGKGTQDVGIVDLRRIESPAMAGNESFAFTLPAGPYSFSGKLITLRWSVEAVLLPGNEAATEELSLSPQGREILLQPM